MEYSIRKNPQFNSLEISFEGKPAEAVRDALKALKFRWHGQKRIWYGFADETAARAAIEGKPQQAAEMPQGKQAKASQGTAQEHVRIYWNGIKIDGGELIRCGYSLDNNRDGSESVSIYARDCGRLPRDLMPVENNSDSYTDYFDNDHAFITPEHPLYKYFRFAGMKAQARITKRVIASYEKELAAPQRWYGRHEYVKQELEKERATLARMEAAEDPGQPTAEDLEQINRQRQEAENARKAEQRAEELRRRERLTAQKINGRRLIEKETAAHPLYEGKTYVLINWSEHPAFYEYQDDSLRLSLTAAENILRQLDEEEHQNEGYYKTSFSVFWTDENGEECSYKGRYDLGDADGGIVEHIRAHGEWTRTHSEAGALLENPPETNDIITFAAFLRQEIEQAAEEERAEAEEEYMFHIFHEIG